MAIRPKTVLVLGLLVLGSCALVNISLVWNASRKGGDSTPAASGNGRPPVSQDTRRSGNTVSDSGRKDAEKAVRDGMKVGYIKEVNCKGNVAYVDEFLWSQVNYKVKEGTARATARYCGQEAVWEVRGYQSGKVLAEIGMLGGIDLK